MIDLGVNQRKFYSILLDMIARSKNEPIMANLLMRCGKTAIGMAIADNYNKVVLVTDQNSTGHYKLIPSTHLIKDETIFFLNSGEID